MTLPRIPQILIEAIKRGNCVLFVGAGLSQAAGLPGWKGLLTRSLSWYEQNSVSVSNLVEIQNLIEQGNLLLAADAIREAVHVEIFRRALSEIIDVAGISPTSTHLLLPRIPFAAILTSNYDRLLETAYAKVTAMPRVFTHSNAPELVASLQDGRIYILKVHGTIDQIETIILGSKSYRELMYDNKAYLEHLKTVFRTKTVLFIGFSLSDPDLEMILDEEQILSRGYTNIHYILTDAREINPIMQQKWQRDYGIHILPYEPSNEYHPEVEEFLKELARQVIEPPTDAMQQVSQPGVDQSDMGTESPALTEAEQSSELLPAQNQISEAISALNGFVNTKNIANEVKQSGEPEDFYLLRLQLFLATRLRSQIPSSMLGLHEANRLYHYYREQLKATGPEFTELLRMLINDYGSIFPGWYWLTPFEVGVVEEVIIHLALTDNYSLVRQRAFALLADAEIPLPQNMEVEVGQAVISDGSPDVRKAAITYLGSVGSESCLPIIGSALVDRDVSVCHEAKRIKILVMARTDPDRSLNELSTEPGIGTRTLLSKMVSAAAAMHSDSLLKALGNDDQDIRWFATKEMRRRGELTINLATTLKQDKYDRVKAEAYRFLIECGEEVSLEEIYLDLHDYSLFQLDRSPFFQDAPPVGKDEILRAFLGKYSFEQLTTMADWSNLGSEVAYRVLALDHFTTFASTLRTDLRNEFASAAERYYEQEVAELTQLYEKEKLTSPPSNLRVGLGSSLLSQMLSTSQASDQQNQQSTPESSARWQVDYKKKGFITSALAGLALHGDLLDVEFGRRYLYHEDYDLRIEAVRLVTRFGIEEDVPDLMKIAKSSEGELKERAARAALRISSFDTEVVTNLIETGDEVLISVVVAELIGYEDNAKLAAILEPYLSADNEEIRTRVMIFFSVSLTREELEQVLARYMSAAVYYYDVVSSFDKALYAPASLWTYFRKEMLEGLYSRTWTYGENGNQGLS